MRSWGLLFLVALPGNIAVRAGVDLASNLPGVILSYSRRRPHRHDAAPSGGLGAEQSARAWPFDSATRHPSDSAYWIARSMCWSGCRDLVIGTILAAC